MRKKKHHPSRVHAQHQYTKYIFLVYLFFQTFADRSKIVHVNTYVNWIVAGVKAQMQTYNYFAVIGIVVHQFFIFFFVLFVSKFLFPFCVWVRTPFFVVFPHDPYAQALHTHTQRWRRPHRNRFIGHASFKQSVANIQFTTTSTYRSIKCTRKTSTQSERYIIVGLWIKIMENIK